MKGLLKVAAIFFIIFINQAGSHPIADDSCGDWTPYKEEKCIKVFEEPGLLGYTDAENFCQGTNQSHLISISREEEQRFIETFLQTQNVVDNVWIGLKFVNNEYQWSDGTELHYTNWDEGSPKYDPEYCVQMETEPTNFGNWSDVLCLKKNLVICEKNQKWTLDQLQTIVTNILNNPVPVGFIYVRLPNEKSPLEIWPTMEWQDVSSDYAGLFFRAVGGDSASFGTVQEADSPRLIHMNIFEYNDTIDAYHIDVVADGHPSQPLRVYGVVGSAGVHLHDVQVTVSKAEVRPRNMAMQIWKRVK